MTNPKYAIASLGQQLGIGVAGASELTVKAVGKQNSSGAPYCIPNELICGWLGQYLRLPVPASGLCIDRSNKPWFASLNFNIAGSQLPPVAPAQCVKLLPSLCTGTLLFDILIANLDRHTGNLSLDTSSAPPRLTVFDHSHALLGYESGQGEARLSLHRQTLGISWRNTDPLASGKNVHCLLQHLHTDEYFDEWLKRIESIPDYYTQEIVDEAWQYGLTAAERDAVIAFLKYRRTNIRSIVTNSKAQFTAINHWRLL